MYIDSLMKKCIKKCAVGLLVVAAAMVVVYRAVNRVPLPELPQNLQVYEIFSDGGCLSCHSADPKLPFYAELPVMGDIVKADVDSGYRAFDMTKFMEDVLNDSDDINPVDLAKVEKVVLDDRTFFLLRDRFKTLAQRGDRVENRRKIGRFRQVGKILAPIIAFGEQT